MGAAQQALMATADAAAELRLWLEMEGSNGGTSFVDSSSRARSVANGSGSVTTSTTQKQVGSTSGRFPGSASAWLTLACDANTPLDGNFCIHAWAWFDAVLPTANEAVMSFLTGTTFELYRRSTGRLTLWVSGAIRIEGEPVSGGEWHHVCAERRSGVIYLYLDNRLQGSYSTASTIGASSGDNEVIGAYDPAAAQDRLTGYVDDLQVYDGAFFNGSPGSAYQKSTWQWVQQTNWSETGSGTTVAATAINLASGHNVFVFVRHEDTAATVTVSDTAGNTYTALTQANTSNGAYGQWFYCLNATGNSSNVITATWSAARTYKYVTAVVYSKASASYDTEQTKAVAAATSITSDAFSTSGAGLVLAGCVSYNNDSSGGVPSAPFYRLEQRNYHTVSQRLTGEALSGSTFTVTGASTTRALCLASFV